MIGWTAWNYVPGFLLLAMCAFAGSTWVTHWSGKGRQMLGAFGLIGMMVVTMFGLIGLMAAPMDSVMQREYWTAKLEKESQQEQFEEERDAALKGLTFGEVKLTCEQIDAANNLGMGELVAPCRLSVGITGVPNE